MKYLSAVSYASKGICGCGQVRAKRLERAFSFFLLPNLACGIFEGGGMKKKNMVFYSPNGPPYNSIVEVGFRF